MAFSDEAIRREHARMTHGYVPHKGGVLVDGRSLLHVPRPLNSLDAKLLHDFHALCFATPAIAVA